MANDKDIIYEQIYFRWKGEGEKRNESIDWYSSARTELTPDATACA